MIENDVILKGQKAVVPKSLQSTYIAILHKGHMSADRTKQLASDVVYWPKMRQDIESAVSQCSACNSCKAHLQKQPLINHPVPDHPWAEQTFLTGTTTSTWSWWIPTLAGSRWVYCLTALLGQ